MVVHSVRIGILGAANIAIRSVIPELLALPELFLVAGIASRDIQTAKKVADQFSIPVYNSYADLIECGQINAIYIPLPNAMHYQWAMKALENGIHVLLEKSLACTYDEVDQLCMIAKSKNLVLLENFQFRFHSQLAFIKQKIAENFIGEIRAMRSWFGFPPFADESNIRYQKDLGGGTLLDAGAYPVKIVQELFGKEFRVKGAQLTMDDRKQVDVSGGAFLVHQTKDFFAQIAFGFQHYYQCNVELWGSKGKMYTNRIFTAPGNWKPLIIFERDNKTEHFELEPDNHFKNMLIYFYQSIRGKKDKNVEFEMNLNQARLLDEIKKMSIEK